MIYPTNDQDFYELIDKKRAEIKSMNIPEDEKKFLYQMVDETIQRYEQNKITFFNLAASLDKWDKSWRKLLKGLEKVGSLGIEIKENLSKMEKILFCLKIKKSFDSQNPRDN